MKTRTGRHNYYKYHEVRERLEEELQVEQPAHQIAGKLKVSISTFHKYKNLLQLEKGRQYMTSDERAYREKAADASANTPALAAVAPERSKVKEAVASKPQPANEAKRDSPKQEAPADKIEAGQKPTKTSERRKK